MSEFYKLKYYVIEAFYEYIIAENFTIRQSVDRCLYEFGKQIPKVAWMHWLYIALFFTGRLSIQPMS